MAGWESAWLMAQPPPGSLWSVPALRALTLRWTLGIAPAWGPSPYTSTSCLRAVGLTLPSSLEPIRTRMFRKAEAHHWA